MPRHAIVDGSTTINNIINGINNINNNINNIINTINNSTTQCFCGLLFYTPPNILPPHTTTTYILLL